MRIWSLHSKYLDTIGLIAAWREGLLAKKVLEGNTVGYKNHPQLIRFRKSKNKIMTINKYLYYLLEESINRGYKFDKKKITEKLTEERIPVHKGQIEYEFRLLCSKLESRNRKKYEELIKIRNIEINMLFYQIEGKTEEWEKEKDNLK